VVTRADRSNEQDEQEPQRARHVPLVAEPQEFRAVNLVKLPKEKPSGNLGCSRICSCQSTKEQQRSTGVGTCELNHSIRSSYFHSISTGFNKRSDLFWEQMESPASTPTQSIVCASRTLRSVEFRRIVEYRLDCSLNNLMVIRYLRTAR
jgi:GTPase SAR1 family protein